MSLSQINIISGQYVDIFNRNIFPAEVHIADGKIVAVNQVTEAPEHYLMPGFIDAHIHIESSMLVPTEFAAIALKHGTVATVSDPHEIANVCGVAGVDYMIENAASSPLKFYFGAPSCVPATSFETAGASIDSDEIEKLLTRPEIKYLAEMMNFPGVLFRDPEVMAKIAAAKRYNKPVDGHAPGLRGADAENYASVGITTDHECFTLEEALDKLDHGMNILIREGSAAKNFTALHPLLKSYPGSVMFCSDDKHPDELIKGHINLLVKSAIALGYDLYDVLHAACILPVLHYNLEVGLLQKGQPADFIIVSDLEQFEVQHVYINGVHVVDEGKCYLPKTKITPINQFSIKAKHAHDFMLQSTIVDVTHVTCAVIEVIDGQLITGRSEAKLTVEGGYILPDIKQDILMIGVVNRYHEAPVAIGFIKNFGLKKGAMASSVAHDSHNIVFVACDAESAAEATNAIIGAKGGISVWNGTDAMVMPLPIAGLMSDQDGITAAAQYELLDKEAKKLGSKLSAPFMSLSFMALPVIPSLKITDKGLFNVDEFAFAPLLTKFQ